jgi:predicted acetyltransferase
MSKIEIAVASISERPVLANLMQFYVHDFSEFWAGRPEGDIEADGRFGDYPLEPYWTRLNHFPLLLRVGGRLAGFALVNDEGHSGAPTDWNMAEFFIARKYRRGGYGTAAAQGVFDRYPGQWEAAVARRNVGALAFWRRAIRDHPRVDDVHEADMATARWNGQIIRFRIAPATSQGAA